MFKAITFSIKYMEALAKEVVVEACPVLMIYQIRAALFIKRQMPHNVVLSGNRHKFTSMFICASLVHPCTSIACFQMKFQVPLAALIRHLSFDEQCRFSIRKRQDRLPAIHLPL